MPLCNEGHEKIIYFSYECPICFIYKRQKNNKLLLNELNYEHEKRLRDVNKKYLENNNEN